MHPNRKFAWSDRDEMLHFAMQRGFATIFGTLDNKITLAHAPITVLDNPDRVQFHLAVGNKLRRVLAGQSILLNIIALDAYISPDWYVSDNQVPTWNYMSVEISGSVRELSDIELLSQLEQLSATHEECILSKTPWTMNKMAPTALSAMMNAITGFEVLIEDVRGTAKLSQNKSAEDFAGAVEGLGTFNPALAAMMQYWRLKT
jgi:transcriptional regulator